MIRSLSVLSASVVALAMAGAAKADNDLIRLDGKGDAEVQETRYYGGGGFRVGVGYGGYRGGFGYGGYRGFGYGGYRGFGYGGYRGFGYGGYRGVGFGYGGYRGFGYGGYYRPYYGYGYGLGLGLGIGYGSYYGGGYGGYYGASYYGVQPYYSSYSLGPCATDTTIVPATTLNLVRSIVPQAPGDGTFPYDGGPRDSNPAPAGFPYRSNMPRDSQFVSVPAAASGYQFLAFGEQPGAAAQQPAARNASDTLRVSYPADGDSMTGFSGGTSVYPAVLR